MSLDETVKEEQSKIPVVQAQQANTALTVHEQKLPTVNPAKVPARKPWQKSWVLALIGGIIAAGAGGAYWWSHRVPPLPPGIAFANGRLEADEIDIQTKFAGRVLRLLVDEGDLVKGGQVLAVMDTRDLQATLKKDEALVEQAQRAVAEANSNAEQLRTQLKLAQQESDRTQELLKKGFATNELSDQRFQQLNGAKAALLAGEARIAEAQHFLKAAGHDVELLKVDIADNTLVAPRDGRIQYRLTNTGEVLGAGGKVFTMLDVDYVYMDVYLPTEQAGKAKIGSDARIVLDAYPNRPIPAHVSFLATQNQFDPKTVETQSERDKFLFRVRVRIDPELLKAHADAVRSGLPGFSYIRLDPKTVWPANLQTDLVQ
ncbi:MAG: HlyD family efflux transporter periplasmic adaptor subunit [Rhodomicrobium sp.]